MPEDTEAIDPDVPSVTERQARLRERAAYRWGIASWMSSGDPDATARHLELFLPKYPSKRVPREIIVDGLRYRVVDGKLLVYNPGNEWIASNYQSQIVNALAGLLANPYEPESQDDDL